MSEQNTKALTGLIAIVFLAAASVFGVKAATGSLDSVYHLTASFSSAGQGLIRDSDVKVHGVNIGRVTHVRLIDGRAQVTLEIKGSQKVPSDGKATIRPKTLFGEKFVDLDPGDKEATGPYFKDGDVIPAKNTIGGFELERVLSELYPILEAVDPMELASVVGTLADASEGLGPEINRQIVNFQKISDVNVKHDADTRQFLDDLAKLSEVLADRSDDLVDAARNLNATLPELNSQAAALTSFLEQGSRLATDVADLLEANRPFLNKSVTEGGKTLQVLFDNRTQVPPLLTGLRQFFQVLAEAGDHEEFEQPDGTRLAAVKLVLGGGSPCGRTTAGCPIGSPSSASESEGAVEETLLPPPGLRLPRPARGARGLSQLLAGLFGSGR